MFSGTIIPLTCTNTVIVSITYGSIAKLLRSAVEMAGNWPKSSLQIYKYSLWIGVQLHQKGWEPRYFLRVYERWFPHINKIEASNNNPTAIQQARSIKDLLYGKQSTTYSGQFWAHQKAHLECHPCSQSEARSR